MPSAALKPCSSTCPNLKGQCPTHVGKSTEAGRRLEVRRGTSRERGYDSRWAKARATYLRSNKLCVECRAEGVVTAASVVDHIVPHRGNQALFWDKANWRALCKPHHDRATVLYDGGFGRARVAKQGVAR